MLEVTKPQADCIKDALKTRMNPALSLQRTGRGGRAMSGATLPAPAGQYLHPQAPGTPHAPAPSPGDPASERKSLRTEI